MTATRIDADRIDTACMQAQASLVRSLPHVLSVAGLGDEARAMLATYAAQTGDLTAVAGMLTAHLGDDAYRVQGWTGAVAVVAAASRDLDRDVRSGEIDHPRWTLTVGARMLAKVHAAAQTASDIVNEMEAA